MRLRIAFVAALLALSAAPAPAADLAQGKLFLNGYGGAAYGQTYRNQFGPATEDGEFAATFAIAAISRAYDDVVAAASIEGATDGEFDIDWAFVEWRLSDLFRLHAGQSKHAFGLYAELEEVGTLRPFFTLPASIYGPVGFMAESYVGVGASGEARRGAWGLQYDVYGGDLRLESIELGEALAPGGVAVPTEEELDHLHELIGGRVTLLTPVSGLKVALSGYHARREEEDEMGGEEINQIVFGPAVEYVNEKTSVRVEYYHLEQGDETSDAGYVEVAQFLGEHVQLAARAEAFRMELEGVAASSFLRHREAALGVNYWINPDFVFKGSVHLVDGNRLAVPELIGPDEDPRDRTWAVVLGSQFTF
jgi:hypothetical protein